MSRIHHDLIILGTGPAGCTASVYASRANLDVLLISGLEQGGQLMKTTDVDNWPGDHDGVMGPDLMQRMMQHAERFGAKTKFDQIKAVDFSKKPLELDGEYDQYSADAVIIATGASARYLGLPSEGLYMGKGVSACATCDGFFFKDQDVAVVGGGNTAVEEALYLSNICKSVTLIHRRNELRAEKMLQERLMDKVNHGNIHVIWEHHLNEVLGDEKQVTGMRLKHAQTGETQDVNIQGIFIAIGHDPNTTLFREQLECDDHGYILVKSGLKGQATASSNPAVFACGDVMDSVYRQAVTSAGTGCMAALDAEKYLAAMKANLNQELASEA